jgi:hypothetical protein
MLSQEDLSTIDDKLFNLKIELQDFIVQEDKKTYSKASSLMHSMAPETRKELDGINSTLKHHIQEEMAMWKQVETMNRAIFGEYDEQGKVITLGMNKKVDRMYEVMIQANGFKSFATSFLLFGAFMSSVFALFEYLRK